MEGYSKITFIVCQKNHHSRLVYEKSTGAGVEFINPCPGVVVDAYGGSDSITNSGIFEFYLNSHAAIQGTSKPTKYSVIYDEIGFKLCEVELLSYWLCYLYARCTKSVSIVTPAYYAHWAARRAKNLIAAGADVADLNTISNLWAANGANHMFFV